MKILNVMTASAALLVGGTATGLAQVPFEANGFPITLHQALVTGMSNIQEQLPDFLSTLGGMPASPMQLAVLEPRTKMTQEQVAQKLTGAGYANLNFEAPAEYNVSATMNGASVKFLINSVTGVIH